MWINTKTVANNSYINIPQAVSTNIQLCSNHVGILVCQWQLYARELRSWIANPWVNCCIYIRELIVPINETHAERDFASLHYVCIAWQAFAIVNNEVVQEPCFERCTNYPFLCYLLQVDLPAAYKYIQSGSTPKIGVSSSMTSLHIQVYTWFHYAYNTLCLQVCGSIYTCK